MTNINFFGRFFIDIKNICTLVLLTNKTNHMRMYLLFMTLFFCSISFAQNTISGSVTDSNNQPVPSANIKIVGENSGTITNLEGFFTLQSLRKPPFVIEVTSVGYGSINENI